MMVDFFSSPFLQTSFFPSSSRVSNLLLPEDQRFNGDWGWSYVNLVAGSQLMTYARKTACHVTFAEHLLACLSTISRVTFHPPLEGGQDNVGLLIGWLYSSGKEKRIIYMYAIRE